MAQMPDYSEFREGPGDNLLAQISSTALEQKEAEAEVARCEEALKSAQTKLRKIAEEDLPALMDLAEMATCETRDGIIVKIQEKVRGSIPKGRERPAFDWLEEHGHDNLIKRQFVIEFGREDQAWAKKFEADLRKRKKQVNLALKETIHPSTLASFVTEQLQEGVDIPLETFGVHRQRATKIAFRED
jgi:hypothetical protein